jgi:hypothetical protein
MKTVFLAIVEECQSSLQQHSKSSSLYLPSAIHLGRVLNAKLNDAVVAVFVFRITPLEQLIRYATCQHG